MNGNRPRAFSRRQFCEPAGNELSRRQFCGLAGKALAGATATAAIAAVAAVPPALLCMTGCATGPLSRAHDLEAAADTGAEAFWFTDSADRRVALPTRITRIAPSGPYAQIMLAALCPELLCSLSSGFSKTQLRFLGEDLADLPVIGRYYGKNANMNYEEVIRLSPDVIVDIGEDKTNIAADMDGIQKQTGIPAIFVEATLPKMAVAITTLGEALGVAAAGQQAAYVQEALAFASDHRAAVAAKKIRVLYCGGAAGLDVVPKGSVHSAVLDMLGLDNVAVLGDTASTLVDIETVMLWAPDVVLVSPDTGFYEEIFADKTWAAVPAVASKRVYEVPGRPYEWLNKPPSVQTVLGLKWLGNLLAPEIYDFDIVTEAQRYYQMFWHYNLGTAEAHELMAASAYMGANLGAGA